MPAPHIDIDDPDDPDVRERTRDYTGMVVAGIAVALLVVGVLAFTTTSDRPLVSGDPGPETTGRIDRAPAPPPPSSETTGRSEPAPVRPPQPTIPEPPRQQ
jgi:hypothetical protein